MADTYSLAADHMSGHEHKPEKKIDHIKVKKVHGGHVHTHVHTRPDHHPDEEHVTQGTDAMVDHLLDHSSDPNVGEAEADMGQSGIPSGNMAQGGAPAPMPQPAMA